MALAGRFLSDSIPVHRPCFRDVGVYARDRGRRRGPWSAATVYVGGRFHRYGAIHGLCRIGVLETARIGGGGDGDGVWRVLCCGLDLGLGVFLCRFSRGVYPDCLLGIFRSLPESWWCWWLLEREEMQTEKNE